MLKCFVFKFLDTSGVYSIAIVLFLFFTIFMKINFRFFVLFYFIIIFFKITTWCVFFFFFSQFSRPLFLHWDCYFPVAAVFLLPSERYQFHCFLLTIFVCRIFVMLSAYWWSYLILLKTIIGGNLFFSSF